MGKTRPEPKSKGLGVVIWNTDDIAEVLQFDLRKLVTNNDAQGNVTLNDGTGRRAVLKVRIMSQNAFECEIGMTVKGQAKKHSITYFLATQDHEGVNGNRKILRKKNDIFGCHISPNWEFGSRSDLITFVGLKAAYDESTEIEGVKLLQPSSFESKEIQALIEDYADWFPCSYQED